MNDTAGYAAWLIESVQGLATRVRELIEHGDNRYSGRPPLSVIVDATGDFASWPLSVTMNAARDIVTELPTLTNMYAPKQPCPRDSGYWYCDGCIRDHLKEQSEREWPILVIQGCGEVFGARICGVTHLGFVWCEECAAAGRIEPHPHIGEHEVVARMAGGCEESQPMYSLYWRGGRPEIVLTE